MATQATDDLSAQIRRLADMEAIKEFKARYIRFADGKNWDEWGKLFLEDAELETESGVQKGRDEIVKRISGSMANGTTVHRVTMPEIEIDGDTAHAVWAMQDVVALDFKGKKIGFEGYGYYHEDYVRTADGWKLKRGKLVRSHKAHVQDPG